MRTLKTSYLFAMTMVLALQGNPAIPAPAPAVSPATAAPELAIDRGHTAVLIMDYENDILGMLPEPARTPLLDRAGAILKAARAAHLPVIYVVVRFRDGYPEISPENKRFGMVKTKGLLREGTPGAEVQARVAPQPGDVVVTKRRVGAFSTTDLEAVLRAKSVTTLALFGVSTSGVVLSTVRWAADMDYQMIVVADACADFDAEVHRVLTEKVFPGQATVVTTQAMTRALGALPKP